MLNIGICDDEREVVYNLEKWVRTFPRPCRVTAFDSGEKLLRAKEHFDVIFLDIDMKGMNGIEAARRLRAFDKKAKIVYVTSYNDYVSYAFSVHAFGYLLKPVKEEQIHRQLKEALAYLSQEEPEELLRFETERGQMELEVKEIYFFEYVNRKIQMHTKGDSYWLRGSMAELAKRLEPHGFCMPHKSFVVNLYHVKSIKGYDIIMMDGSWIPLSQKKSVEFREKLSAFLAKQI